MSDIAKRLAEFNKKGLEEESSGVNFEEALIKITGVDTSMSGPSSKYDNLKKIEHEMAFIIFTIKVGDGEHKGETFKWHTVLLSKSGNVKCHKAFLGEDGKKVSASELYEVIHAIKEHDEKQWDEELLTPDKFLKKKFKFEIGKVGEELKLNTTRAKENYEEWKKKQEGSKVEDEDIEDIDLDEEDF